MNFAGREFGILLIITGGMRCFRSLFCPTITIAGFFIAVFLAAPSVSAAEAVWHLNGYQVTGDTTWQTGEVHVIADYAVISIGPGATLTIEPGVIVKVGLNSSINVYGSLLTSGNPDSLVYIVSLRDDTVGGDTNGDGAATIAGLGDWRGLAINGFSYNSTSTLELNYTVIKSGGRGFPRGMVINTLKAASVKINHCDIGDDNGIIFIDAASRNIAITNSNLYNPNFCDYASSTEPCHWDNGVKSFSSQVIDLTGNYWGSADGPTYTTGVTPEVFSGTVLANLCGGQISYQPFAVKPYDFNHKPKRHPVIIIPGILGSWPNADGTKLVLDPITHTYDDLYAALEQAGYVPGVSLFTFPYQWRNSNIITAQKLKLKIDEVKAVCIPGEIMDCSKVDLIGHSMGGLVARQYIESNDYGGDVDQMIFIATPHKGAPFAYAAWEGGYMGKGFKNDFLWTILSLEAGKKTGIWGDAGLVTYMHNYNIFSVQELLPIYNYLYDQDAGKVRYYPVNYPTNPFLENLNSAENLAKLKSAVKITNIVGNSGNNTISGFNVVASTKLPLWENGMPADFYGSQSGVLTDIGDETVPNFSNSGFANSTDIIINKEHGEIVGYSQKEVIKELTGKYPEIEIHNNNITNLLMISLGCPADIQIIAPDGKRLGKDFIGGSVINEITGAYYTNPGDDILPEFAIIPNPIEGEYRVKVIGTGEGGAYSLTADYITESTSTETNCTGVVLPDQEQTLNIDFAATKVNSISADITIQTAINDVSLVYERKLLSDKSAKQKIISIYSALKLKVALADTVIKLAEKSKSTLIANNKLNSALEAKLLAVIDRQLNSLKAERGKMILNSLTDLNKYLDSLLSKNVLAQLGYDILKANNNYLINNW